MARGVAGGVLVPSGLVSSVDDIGDGSAETVVFIVSLELFPRLSALLEVSAAFTSAIAVGLRVSFPVGAVSAIGVDTDSAVEVVLGSTVDAAFSCPTDALPRLSASLEASASLTSAVAVGLRESLLTGALCVCERSSADVSTGNDVSFVVESVAVSPGFVGDTVSGVATSGAVVALGTTSVPAGVSAIVEISGFGNSPITGSVFISAPGRGVAFTSSGSGGFEAALSVKESVEN